MLQTDERFMAAALRLACRGLGRTWPNPAVGALLVKDGEVLARGWTGRGGRPHAEAVALERAGAGAEAATLYVTLEPCSHQGRGAPCANAIVSASVARVVCALHDPDSRVDGQGFDRLRKAGIAVTTGVLEAEARWLTLGHILRVTRQRPFVQVKVAVGSDGLIAPGQGSPTWVTSEQARARAHLLRARADAILVGRGTIEADDPLLTCRLPGLEERSPVRIVLDSGLRMPPEARLLANARSHPVWIVTTAGTPDARAESYESAGAEVIRVTASPRGRVDIEAALETLAGRGITRLLVEGGPRVASSFLDMGFVDEVLVFQGAAPAGEGSLQPFGDAGLERIADSGQFVLRNERPVGPDLMRVYRRQD
jgi:diaminohydroxyphosphoribosylaminopyrimidine deaminase/5-amino-6-(5-phosphoribosylamino)uracil reductase